MKDSTIEWIISRILDCVSTSKYIEENSPERVKDKRYYGIQQELNTLRRILRMEDLM